MDGWTDRQTEKEVHKLGKQDRPGADEYESAIKTKEKKKIAEGEPKGCGDMRVSRRDRIFFFSQRVSRDLDICWRDG